MMKCAKNITMQQQGRTSQSSRNCVHVLVRDWGGKYCVSIASICYIFVTLDGDPGGLPSVEFVVMNLSWKERFKLNLIMESYSNT